MNPVLYTFDDIQVRYFGILFAVGILLVFILLRSSFKTHGIHLPRNELMDWFLITFIYGVLGARIYYVLFNLPYYFGPGAQWFEFFAVWRGGLAMNGGLITSCIILWYLCRDRNLSFGKVSDLVAPPLFLLQALVRFGNFMNGEVYGKPTGFVFGMIFRQGPAADQYPNTYIHPVMLYEALLSILGYILLSLINPNRFRNGFIAAAFLFIYSLIRLFSSRLSMPELTLFGISESMISGVLGLLISGWLILTKKLYRNPGTTIKPAPKRKRRRRI